MFRFLLVLAFLSLPTVGSAAPIEGFGSSAAGGTQSCVVNSLDDSGAGTLRSCLSATDRLITFSVGGTIYLFTRLTVLSRTTIDATSAPSPGITLDGSQWQETAWDIPLVSIKSSSASAVREDIIVRGLRFQNHATGNAIEIYGPAAGGGVCRRIAFDHISMLDSGDENFTIWENAEDVTLQWSILGYAVGSTAAHKYALLVGGSVAPKRISIHHNLFVAGDQRNPQVDKATDVDVRNNVVRHWTNYGARFRDGATANFVNNDYYTNVTSLGSKGLIVVPINEASALPPAGPIWVSGNKIPQEAGLASLGLATAEYAVAPVTTDPVDTLEAIVLASVGAARTAFDEGLVNYARVYTPATGPVVTPTPSPTGTPASQPSNNPSSDPATSDDANTVEDGGQVASGGCRSDGFALWGLFVILGLSITRNFAIARANRRPPEALRPRRP